MAEFMSRKKSSAPKINSSEKYFKNYDIVFIPKPHYENMPIQIYWKFYHQKWKFSDKTFWYFFIFLLKT